MRTHGLNPVAQCLMCRSKLVRSDLRHICRLVEGVIYHDDTVQFVSLTHIVANRGAGRTIITG